MQTPQVILNQVRQNLRSADEISERRRKARSVVRYLAENGFEALAEELNENFRLPNVTHRFSASDFEGSTAYPDDDFDARHTAKHSLPSLSYGISMQMPQWERLAEYLHFDPTQREQSYPGTTFRRSTMALDELVISLHIQRGEDFEFALVRQDSCLYAETHESWKRIEPRRLTTPQFAMLTVEYLLLADMSAHRTDPHSTGDSLIDYLTKRLDYFAQAMPQWLGVPIPLEERPAVAEAYRKIMAGPRERIPDAIRSMYDLQERIGDQLLTPVLFSLGSTKEELAMYHLLSPFIGLTKLGEYVRTGEVSVDELKQIISEKGYTVRD